MKTETVEVKSQSEVVGEASFPHYDNTQEVLDGIGEVKMLELVNSQVKTNAMNLVRAEKTGKPSKIRQRSNALAAAPTEELVAASGDADLMDALIAKYLVADASE